MSDTDFNITQSGMEQWDIDRKVWLFRFVVRHPVGELIATVGVSPDTSEVDRFDEAKKQFRAFAAAMSAEVAAW